MTQVAAACSHGAEELNRYLSFRRQPGTDALYVGRRRDGATVQTVVTSPPYDSLRPSLGAATITQESAKQAGQCLCCRRLRFDRAGWQWERRRANDEVRQLAFGGDNRMCGGFGKLPVVRGEKVRLSIPAKPYRSEFSA